MGRVDVSDSLSVKKMGVVINLHAALVAVNLTWLVKDRALFTSTPRTLTVGCKGSALPSRSMGKW